MIVDIKQTEYPHYVDAVRTLIAGKNMKAHVMTFGCQQNEADSEKARGILSDMGYIISNDYNECDIILVNTCAIRAHAEMKALSMLGNFRAVKRKNPDLIVGVFGCMAAENGIVEKLKKDFHYVSFTIEPNMIHTLPENVYKIMHDNKRSFVFGKDEGNIIEYAPVMRSKGSKAWVSIMYGCNNFCSYCIVPYVRGRERSRDSKTVLAECRELVVSGIKEITLLGQNVNSYKSDKTFAQLLESIANIEGEFIVRFMTSHPKDVSSELIDVMKKYEGKIAPYFHLPLQSGSDRILSLMNRTYNRERYLSVVSKLREAIPDICLSTDVIIGFPTETEEDFLGTMDILEKVRFDMVYSFNYSPREGTRAAVMEGAVPDEVKDVRMKKLLLLQDKISYEKNAEYIGKKVRVLVESLSKKDDKVYTARTDSNKLVHIKLEENKIGEFINAEVNGCGAFDLFAEEIK